MPAVPASESNAVARSSSAAATTIRNAFMAGSGLADDVLELFEDRAVLVRARFGRGERLGELLQETALLGTEAARHHHAHAHVQIAPPLGPEVRHPVVAQAEAGARLRALRNADPGGLAVQGRHVDGGPERRLGEADGHLAEQARALPTEERVLGHAHHHVEVAGGAALRATFALARDAELAARVHAGGNLDGELALHLDVSGTVAGLTGSADDLARSAALAAGAGHAEEALLERDLTAATAGAAGAGGGARR